jgi:energy-converting hydrogenase A subunit M
MPILILNFQETVGFIYNTLNVAKLDSDVIQKITTELEITPEEFQDYIEQSLQKLESLSELLS